MIKITSNTNLKFGVRGSDASDEGQPVQCKHASSTAKAVLSSGSLDKSKEVATLHKMTSESSRNRFTQSHHHGSLYALFIVGSLS